MEYLVLIIALMVGAAIGIVIENVRLGHNVMGWLRVDRSEPDEPTRLFLELKNVTPEMIAQRDFVMFKVVNESYISHD